MEPLQFFKFDPWIAGVYAVLVLILVAIYRRAKSIGARLTVYIISVILVFVFLLLFAPR